MKERKLYFLTSTEAKERRYRNLHVPFATFFKLNLRNGGDEECI
jgi:hypothetical protein